LLPACGILRSSAVLQKDYIPFFFYGTPSCRLPAALPACTAFSLLLPPAHCNIYLPAAVLYVCIPSIWVIHAAVSVYMQWTGLLHVFPVRSGFVRVAADFSRCWTRRAAMAWLTLTILPGPVFRLPVRTAGRVLACCCLPVLMPCLYLRYGCGSSLLAVLDVAVFCCTEHWLFHCRACRIMVLFAAACWFLPPVNLPGVSSMERGWDGGWFGFQTDSFPCSPERCGGSKRCATGCALADLPRLPTFTTDGCPTAPCWGSAARWVTPVPLVTG